MSCGLRGEMIGVRAFSSRRQGFRTAVRGAVVLAAALGLVVALAGCRPKAAPVTLTAPWLAGEKSVLEVKDGSGGHIGDWTMGVEAGAAGEAWVLTNLNTGNGSEWSAVHVGADLVPLRIDYELKDAAGEAVATLQGVYSGGKLAITAKVRGQDQTATVKLPAPPYFDNEQFVTTLRALPLAEGFQTVLNDIVSKNGAKTQLTAAVTGRETVTVPAGTFDCWIVELRGANQRAWIAAAPPRQLVKYTNDAAKTVSELKEYTPGQ